MTSSTYLKQKKRYLVLQDSNAKDATSVSVNSRVYSSGNDFSEVQKSEVSRFAAVDVERQDKSSVSIVAYGEVGNQGERYNDSSLDVITSIPTKSDVSGSGSVITSGDADEAFVSLVKSGQSNVQFRSPSCQFGRMSYGLESSSSTDSVSVTYDKIYSRLDLLPLSNGNLLSVHIESEAPPGCWTFEAGGFRGPGGEMKIRLLDRTSGLWSDSLSVYPAASLRDNMDFGLKNEAKLNITGVSLVQDPESEEIFISYCVFYGQPEENFWSNYHPAYLIVDRLKADVSASNLFVASGRIPSAATELVSISSLNGGMLESSGPVSTYDVAGMDSVSKPFDLSVEILSNGRFVACVFMEDAVWSLVSTDKGVSFSATKIKQFGDLDQTLGHVLIAQRHASLDTCISSDGSIVLVIACPNANTSDGYGDPFNSLLQGGINYPAVSTLSIFVSSNGYSWGAEKNLCKETAGFYQEPQIHAPSFVFGSASFDNSICALDVSVCLNEDSHVLVSAVSYNVGGVGGSHIQNLYQRVLDVKNVPGSSSVDDVAIEPSPAVHSPQYSLCSRSQRLQRAYPSAYRIDDFRDSNIWDNYIDEVSAAHGSAGRQYWLGQLFLGGVPAKWTGFQANQTPTSFSHWNNNSGIVKYGGGPMRFHGPISVATCLWNGSVVTSMGEFRSDYAYSYPARQHVDNATGDTLGLEYNFYSSIKVLFSGSLVPAQIRIPTTLRWEAKAISADGNVGTFIQFDDSTARAFHSTAKNYHFGSNSWQLAYDAAHLPEVEKTFEHEATSSSDLITSRTPAEIVEIGSTGYRRGSLLELNGGVEPPVSGTIQGLSGDVINVPNFTIDSFQTDSTFANLLRVGNFVRIGGFSTRVRLIGLNSPSSGTHTIYTTDFLPANGGTEWIRTNNAGGDPVSEFWVTGSDFVNFLGNSSSGDQVFVDGNSYTFPSASDMYLEDNSASQIQGAVITNFNTSPDWIETQSNVSFLLPGQKIEVQGFHTFYVTSVQNMGGSPTTYRVFLDDPYSQINSLSSSMSFDTFDLIENIQVEDSFTTGGNHPSGYVSSRVGSTNRFRVIYESGSESDYVSPYSSYTIEFSTKITNSFTVTSSIGFASTPSNPVSTSGRDYFNNITSRYEDNNSNNDQYFLLSLSNFTLLSNGDSASSPTFSDKSYYELNAQFKADQLVNGRNSKLKTRNVHGTVARPDLSAGMSNPDRFLFYDEETTNMSFIARMVVNVDSGGGYVFDSNTSSGSLFGAAHSGFRIRQGADNHGINCKVYCGFGRDSSDPTRVGFNLYDGNTNLVLAHIDIQDDGVSFVDGKMKTPTYEIFVSLSWEMDDAPDVSANYGSSTSTLTLMVRALDPISDPMMLNDFTVATSSSLSLYYGPVDQDISFGIYDDSLQANSWNHSETVIRVSSFYFANSFLTTSQCRARAWVESDLAYLFSRSSQPLPDGLVGGGSSGVSRQNIVFEMDPTSFGCGLGSLKRRNAGVFSPSLPPRASSNPFYVDDSIQLSFAGSMVSGDAFSYYDDSLFRAENVFSLPISTGWRSDDRLVDFTNNTTNTHGYRTTKLINPNCEMVFDFGANGVFPKSICMFGLNTDGIIVDFYDDPDTGLGYFPLPANNSNATLAAWHNNKYPIASVWFGSPGSTIYSLYEHMLTTSAFSRPESRVTFRFNYMWHWHAQANRGSTKWHPYVRSSSNVDAAIDSSVSSEENKYIHFHEDDFPSYHPIVSDDKDVPMVQQQASAFIPGRFKSGKGENYYLALYINPNASSSSTFGDEDYWQNAIIQGLDSRERAIFKIEDNGTNWIKLTSSINDKFHFGDETDLYFGENLPNGASTRKFQVNRMSIFSDRVATNLPDNFVRIHKSDPANGLDSGGTTENRNFVKCRYMRIRLSGGMIMDPTEKFLKLGSVIAGERIELSNPDIEWGYSYDIEFGNKTTVGITGQRRCRKSHKPRRSWSVSYSPLKSPDSYRTSFGSPYKWEQEFRGYGSTQDMTETGSEQRSSFNRLSWIEAVQRILNLEVYGPVFALCFDADGMLNVGEVQSGSGSNSSSLNDRPALADPHYLCAARVVSYDGADHVGYGRVNAFGSNLASPGFANATNSNDQEMLQHIGFDVDGSTTPIMKIKKITFSEEF